MKKLNKFTAVSLCLVLLLVISFSTPVSADTVTQITPDIESITSPIDNGIELTSAVDPIGSLDVVNEYQIGGWAYQSDIPNTPLDVHLYVRSHATGEADIFSTTANGYRADLYNAGYGNGYHAFQYLMDWFDYPAGVYSIEAYAIGTHGYNPPLNYSPQNFTVESMTGNVEYVNSNGIGGWAWKSASPDSEIRVHIYIQNSAGETLAIYNTTANQVRPDLLAAGYGNGAHGFSYPIDWSTLPEEWLRVIAYAVDGTGTHPVFYDGWYDNRKAIYLLGMVDFKGYDSSTWMWNEDVVTYCQNIGCTSLIRNNIADADYYTRAIRESSYCAIATHGYGPDEETGEMEFNMIQCNMQGVYNDHIDCDKDFCPTCLGWYSTDDLKALPSDYFSTTRCVVVAACYSGYNGEENPDNFVNVLHSRGVQTVVGFEETIQDLVNETTKEVYTDRAGQRWLTVFTENLGLGATVTQAAASALSAARDNVYGTFGLDKICIVGDEHQIVKH